MIVEILADEHRLHLRAAAEFSRLVRASRGVFRVALSGGETPRGLYALLAKAELPWKRIHFFWGDERRVPCDHPQSNFKAAWDALLSKIPAPPGNIHRIPVEFPDAPERYDALLRGQFKLRRGRFPRFDLVLLGLGADGHVASLFPGSAALHERVKLARAVRSPKPPPGRVTLTLPVLNHAANVLFLVSGKEKTAILRKAMKPGALPAQRVRPSEGDLLWLVDRAASGSAGPIPRPPS